MIAQFENGENREHDIKSSLQFLKNLYQEITLGSNIKDLQDPLILNKLRQTIEFLEKILST